MVNGVGTLTSTNVVFLLKQSTHTSPEAFDARVLLSEFRLHSVPTTDASLLPTFPGVVPKHCHRCSLGVHGKGSAPSRFRKNQLSKTTALMWGFSGLFIGHMHPELPGGRGGARRFLLPALRSIWGAHS